MIKKQILSLSILTILASLPVLAEDTKTGSSILPVERNAETMAEAKPSVGLMLGTFIPDDGSVATTNIGIDFMIQPRIPFSFGFEVSHAKPESDVTGKELQHTALLAKAQYNFGGEIPVIRQSYMALGAGTQLQESDSQFAAAAILGFDIPLKNENENLRTSLGANAKYMYVEGTEDKDSNAVALNGVFKFWY